VLIVIPATYFHGNIVASQSLVLLCQWHQYISLHKSKKSRLNIGGIFSAFKGIGFFPLI